MECPTFLGAEGRDERGTMDGSSPTVHVLSRYLPRQLPLALFDALERLARPPLPTPTPARAHAAAEAPRTPQPRRSSTGSTNAHAVRESASRETGPRTA